MSDGAPDHGSSPAGDASGGGGGGGTGGGGGGGGGGAKDGEGAYARAHAELMEAMAPADWDHLGGIAGDGGEATPAQLFAQLSSEIETAHDSLSGEIAEVSEALTAGMAALRDTFAKLDSRLDVLAAQVASLAEARPPP